MEATNVQSLIREKAEIALRKDLHNNLSLICDNITLKDFKDIVGKIADERTHVSELTYMRDLLRNKSFEDFVFNKLIVEREEIL